jgi:hypothetical protein
LQRKGRDTNYKTQKELEEIKTPVSTVGDTGKLNTREILRLKKEKLRRKLKSVILKKKKTVPGI